MSAATLSERSDAGSLFLLGWLLMPQGAQSKFISAMS